jgi:hypothetical protein
VQGEPDPGPDDGAVDADELQVAAEEQLQLTRRLGGVPALDGAGHQARELVVELIGERAGP